MKRSKDFSECFCGGWHEIVTQIIQAISTSDHIIFDLNKHFSINMENNTIFVEIRQTELI